MIKIFIGAIIFSIWSIVLFFGKRIGMSMLLFATPITLFIINILEKNNKEINKKAKILIIPITLLSSTYFIFNNEFFNTLNIFTIPILTIIMILKLLKEELKINIDSMAKIIEIIFAPLSYIHETFEELIKIIKEKMKIKVDLDRSKKIKKVIKSICITMPIVIIIIVLLSSSDEIFSQIFNETYKTVIHAISQIKISTVAIKIILTIGIFIYLISLFYYLIIRRKSEEYIYEEEKEKDNFTIKMILTTLNIIYLIFSIVQIQTLYTISDGVKYSYYARQGFFQLMIVSIINLVTILIAKKRENKNEEKSNRYINVMSLTMIVFTFIILVSAVIRMYFYETAYGYTLLRLLVYCSLFTEAVLLIPTALYIIGKKINLLKSYFTIILTIYICMNFMNFDYIIAKRNVERYVETGKIDIQYLKNNTDTDAVKELIKLMDLYENEDKDYMMTGRYLQQLYKRIDRENMDFRDFNISKVNAKRLIEESEILDKEYEKTFDFTFSANNTQRDDEYYNKYEWKPSKEEIVYKEGDLVYKKEIDENIILRVMDCGAISGQCKLIRIQKSIDKGTTWEDQIDNVEGVMTVNLEAEVIFFDENNGFINNYSLIRKEYENDGLLVTTDGGKSFVSAEIIWPNALENTCFALKELPYKDGEQFKIKLYETDYSGVPLTTYYEFRSIDNGLSWEYYTSDVI